MISIITNDDNIRSQKFNETLKACGKTQLYITNLNQDVAFKIICKAFEKAEEIEFDESILTD